MAADTPEQAASQLNSDAERLADSKLVGVILKNAAIAMKASVFDNFNKSAGPDGTPWARLRFPRVRGGDKPLLDTGQLRASVTTKTKDHVENVTVNSIEIGTVRPGASLMQSGGTVVPTKAKALTIPLTKEALRAGGPRRFPRRLIMLWRKGAKSGVLAEIKKGKQSKESKKLHKAAKLAGKKKGFEKVAAGFKERAKQLDKKRGVTTIQYALVKSVTVPARPFIGFGPKLVEQIETIAAAVMSKAAMGKGAKLTGAP